MKVIFKSGIVFALFMFLAIWLPHYIAGTGTTASADSDSQGSTIGGIEIGNLKGEELKTEIANAVNDWYAQPTIITDGGKSIQVSTSTFQFDIDGTVKYYEENYKKPWYAFWANDTTVHLPLNVQPSEIVKNEISNISSWNTEATYERVVLNASYLRSSEVDAVVEELAAIDTDRISLSIEAVPEDVHGLSELVAILNDITIEPQATFSLLENLGGSIQLANREAINFIASNVYNAALYINGEIVERHSQNKIPSYLKPGIEAQVDASSNEDLQFINTLSTPVQLKLTIEEKSLKTEVYTTFKDIGVLVSVSRDEVIQPRTIIRFSDELDIGKTEQLQEGTDGLRVAVYRTVYGEKTLISRDYYSPVSRILLKSSRQPVTGNTSGEDSIEWIDDSATDVDLDGDGFPDGDLGSDSSATYSQIEDEEDELPPGSYYDKGGNLITPTKGGK